MKNNKNQEDRTQDYFFDQTFNLPLESLFQGLKDDWKTKIDAIKSGEGITLGWLKDNNAFKGQLAYERLVTLKETLNGIEGKFPELSAKYSDQLQGARELVESELTYLLRRDDLSINPDRKFFASPLDKDPQLLKEWPENELARKMKQKGRDNEPTRRDTIAKAHELKSSGEQVLTQSGKNVRKPFYEKVARIVDKEKTTVRNWIFNAVQDGEL